MAFLLDTLTNRINYISDLSQHASFLAGNPNALIIFSGFAACLLVLILIFWCSKPSKHPKAELSDALQALFTVIAPTSVAWPRDYAHLVTHSTSSRSKTISISMTSLIAKVHDGEVELRNYVDLSDLFSENLVVYGWSFRLTLDTPWNLEVLRWVIGSYFWRRQPAPISNHRPALKRVYGASDPKPADPSPSGAPLSFSLISNQHLDLDYLPFSCLESSLLELRATLAPGTYATLEFTTPAPHVTFLSPQFTLCAVPFLPRKRARPSPKGTTEPGLTRTATPLLASPHRVLELLTAGPGALALENVSNVSIKYAEGLTAAAEHLEDDRLARGAFIDRWGEAGWREQRLMMVWEAALFSAGLLTRWVVIVRK
ncbi:hypothetical protein DFH06DRAFT_1463538 [Mycena polygramma]|nr:hypothetical protein DFH06DRAFT_1463538 [Mycena polygramma]